MQETWVLQIQKAHAKSAKDALKALGFLDRRRKVPAGDRSDPEVALPVTPPGAAFLDSCTESLADRQNGSYRTDSAGAAVFTCSSSQRGISHEDAKSGATSETRAGEALAQQVSLNELEQLIAQGAAWVQRKQAVQRSGRATPADALLGAALSVLASKGPPATQCLWWHLPPFSMLGHMHASCDSAPVGGVFRMLDVKLHQAWVGIAGLSQAEIAALTPEIPSKWERLGDLALLPSSAFLSSQWAPSGQLWDRVAAALAVTRLARQAPIANTGTPCLRLT